MRKKRSTKAKGEGTRMREELDRLLTMIPYLYENGRVPVEEVARRFDLTPKEVVGAIDRIATLGDPLLDPHQLIDAYIEDGHVGIDLEPAVRRPTRLTARQAFALIAGAGVLRAEGLTISPALERAVEKVKQATGRGDQAQLEELGRLVSVEQAGEALSEVFRALERARVQRERVEIEYLPAAGRGITTRKIDPYLLWNHAGAWYCAAWCHLRGGTRTFRVSRIRSVRPVGERFEVAQSFDASKYGDAPLYVPSPGALCVRVRFSPSVARYVEERHGGEIVERGKNGSVVVATSARSDAWVVGWLLPYGPEAEALEPPSAREAMREACREILSRYQRARA
jgi:predicted DNA-binding transcriptional regulator YafY